MLNAIAAGALLGAIALVSRYAQAPRAAVEARSSTPSSLSPSMQPQPPAPTASSEAQPLVTASASVISPAPALPMPRPPRSARYDADPEIREACPRDMTLVDGAFCPALDYECVRPTGAVGCAEYARGKRCLDATEHRRFCVDRYEWPNRLGENPLVYVDWFEAKALCAEAGKRLCRRSEWMLACEGPKRLPFPWGFVRQPSPCNVDRAPIRFDVNAMIDARTREEELARLWQADPIGAHPDCVSAFGAYDMAGNVDEWTDDEADDPATKHKSTLNGGYWGPVRDTCRLATKSHGPTFKFYQVGFRCCGDAAGEQVTPPRPWTERDARPEPGR